MPKPHICSFCGKEFSHGMGLMYVKTDATVLWFCSSKCRRNLDLKRDPKKVNWVKRKKKDKTTTQPKETPGLSHLQLLKYSIYFHS